MFKIGDNVKTHLGDLGIVSNIRFQNRGEVVLKIGEHKYPWRTSHLTKILGGKR